MKGQRIFYFLMAWLMVTTFGYALALPFPQQDKKLPKHQPIQVVSSHAAIVIAAINNAVNSLKIFIILEMCLISEAYSSSGHTSLMNVL